MKVHATRGSILVVRLGAMGDIVHALPAVTSLKLSFPEHALTWVVKSRWTDLLEGNPYVDRVLAVGDQERMTASGRRLWSMQPQAAFDFQGLLQSALIGRLARPKVFWGFDRSVARERFASRFYTRAVRVTGPHRIQRNLQLVRAAGATQITEQVWLPQGRAEGDLPASPFVLASPFAGWAGKQWPLQSYAQLAALLAREGVPLVMNVSGELASSLHGLPNVHVHVSSIAGLIYATRRAAAVVGVDSGPLHIAAGLSKRGVAIFGPTDPAATGPYGGSMQVLRTPEAHTTYDRHKEIQASMLSIEPSDVFSAVLQAVGVHPSSAVSSRS
ncbi:MAG: lipopolysaccharide heptosyltransferase [Bryobacterales bacterium]|nr:lipopolysaccharide heptosyltransferase [Bryobacterales bacterium]